MMLILYSLATQFYFLVIRVFSVFNNKAKKLYQGQSKALEQLANHFQTNHSAKVIWIHTASLGEFEQGRPIIESLKKHHKDIHIVLTFFSPSGYEIRSNYNLADVVTYLPFDTRKNTEKFVELTMPILAIFIKY